MVLELLLHAQLRRHALTTMVDLRRSQMASYKGILSVPEIVLGILLEENSSGMKS